MLGDFGLGFMIDIYRLKLNVWL